jgi:hypothetical protein
MRAPSRQRRHQGGKPWEAAVMDIGTLKSVLAFVTLINAAFLAWWILLFIFARGWMYRMHSRWFRITEEQFGAIHYAGMGMYKLLIILFAFTPWLALVILT